MKNIIEKSAVLIALAASVFVANPVLSTERDTKAEALECALIDTPKAYGFYTRGVCMIVFRSETIIYDERGNPGVAPIEGYAFETARGDEESRREGQRIASRSACKDSLCQSIRAAK